MAVLLSDVRGAVASDDRTTDARDGLRRGYDAADPIRSRGVSVLTHGLQAA
jgi:hypothetical protein